MNWEELNKLIDKALERTMIDVSDDNQIATELDKAWNRGAKVALSNALILFAETGVFE